MRRPLHQWQITLCRHSAIRTLHTHLVHDTNGHAIIALQDVPPPLSEDFGMDEADKANRCRVWVWNEWGHITKEQMHVSPLWRDQGKRCLCLDASINSGNATRHLCLCFFTSPCVRLDLVLCPCSCCVPASCRYHVLQVNWVTPWILCHISSLPLSWVTTRHAPTLLTAQGCVEGSPANRSLSLPHPSLSVQALHACTLTGWECGCDWLSRGGSCWSMWTYTAAQHAAGTRGGGLGL